ncbi:MAG: hypothetical protein KDN19_15965, partial [Verrucomicrobiae bacterium]|nr:hypothetical protein [Verrucomicrobiae bacterium]
MFSGRGDVGPAPVSGTGKSATYSVREILPFLPPSLVSQDHLPLDKSVPVPLPAEGTEVKLSTIQSVCPEIFATEITPLNDSEVTLPQREDNLSEGSVVAQSGAAGFSIGQAQRRALFGGGGGGAGEKKKRNIFSSAKSEPDPQVRASEEGVPVPVGAKKSIFSNPFSSGGKSNPFSAGAPEPAQPAPEGGNPFSAGVQPEKTSAFVNPFASAPPTDEMAPPASPGEPVMEAELEPPVAPKEEKPVQPTSVPDLAAKQEEAPNSEKSSPFGFPTPKESGPSIFGAFGAPPQPVPSEMPGAGGSAFGDSAPPFGSSFSGDLPDFAKPKAEASPGKLPPANVSLNPEPKPEPEPSPAPQTPMPEPTAEPAGEWPAAKSNPEPETSPFDSPATAPKDSAPVSSKTKSLFSNQPWASSAADGDDNPFAVPGGWKGGKTVESEPEEPVVAEEEPTPAPEFPMPEPAAKPAGEWPTANPNPKPEANPFESPTMAPKDSASASSKKETLFSNQPWASPAAGGDDNPFATSGGWKGGQPAEPEREEPVVAEEENPFDPPVAKTPSDPWAAPEPNDATENPSEVSRSDASSFEAFFSKTSGSSVASEAPEPVPLISRPTAEESVSPQPEAKSEIPAPAPEPPVEDAPKPSEPLWSGSFPASIFGGEPEPKRQPVAESEPTTGWPFAGGESTSPSDETASEADSDRAPVSDPIASEPEEAEAPQALEPISLPASAKKHQAEDLRERVVFSLRDVLIPMSGRTGIDFSNIPPSAKVRLPVSLIEPQLATGEVALRLSDLARHTDPESAMLLKRIDPLLVVPLPQNELFHQLQDLAPEMLPEVNDADLEAEFTTLFASEAESDEGLTWLSPAVPAVASPEDLAPSVDPEPEVEAPVEAISGPVAEPVAEEAPAAVAKPEAELEAEKPAPKRVISVT